MFQTGAAQFYLGDGVGVASGNGVELSREASNGGPGLAAKEAAAKRMMGMGANAFGRMMGALPGMGMRVGMGASMGSMGFGMGLARAVGCIGGGGKGAGMVDSDKKQSRRWAADEHHRFLAGVKTCGPKSCRQIADIVGARNAKQVRAQCVMLKSFRESWSESCQKKGCGGWGRWSCRQKMQWAEVTALILRMPPTLSPQ
eukprot:Plantae.Rhodophyta-Hildenbrandia_rubra.ctg10836.p1 GENE.Plantae.Rhodophyta-Hildenbrandia_rubra.ctg10836~~Plantae.Rhodophyta-Hildenbrandia_rubra.ctg10836.p1  ORF type:complete len:200 (-),score=34.93 Plantae.Rhodophyta-Hildenbrandia_rubra.ctg10836:8-607(-)